MELKDFKWLISSCLQKSIRRGFSELTEKYIDFLWEVDRNYVTYRLGTILTEDVGIANPELLKKYLDTKIAKSNIEACGGKEFLKNIAIEASLSVKDRSSCDAAYLASYYKIEKNKTLEELESIFLNNEDHFINRINAGWIILGNSKYKNDMLDFNLDYPLNTKNKQIDNLNRYIDTIRKLNIEEIFLSIIENAYSTQIENISLGIPIIKSIYKFEEGKVFNNKIKTGDIIQNKYIKEEIFYSNYLGLPLISCGIDGHTKEGKYVYYQYLKENTEFTKYLKEYKINYEDYFNILSHCMFRLEGHEVNNRIFFPTAVQVMRNCEQDILKFKSKNKHISFNELASILKKDMATINQIREAHIAAIDKDNKLSFKIP